MELNIHFHKHGRKFGIGTVAEYEGWQTPLCSARWMRTQDNALVQAGKIDLGIILPIDILASHVLIRLSW